ncbi:hypothetical protein C8Q77DRAFT_1200026 [Trametes polyzona]|nr:hypothetical protein C8Q77DRAFT_1200026 [Trametes polyzona]
MGSAQSVISAAAVLAIVGAIAYGFIQPGDPTASTASSSGQQPPVASSSTGKKKQKKKAGAVSSATESAPAAEPKTKPEPTVVAFPPVVPGGFDAALEPGEKPGSGPGAAAKSKAKKKKGKKASSPVPQDAQSESSATAPESSAARKPRKSATPKPAGDDDGWTRVETKKKTTQAGQRAGGDAPAASTSAAERPLEISTSDAGITTSFTGNSSPVTERTEDESHSAHADVSASENRRTLAEKLLPKPRKTGVEDVLEEPDYPQLARVMRIQPRPDERPAAGFSWGDYEDVDESRATADDADGEDDGGWGVVKSKRSKPKQPSSGAAQTPTAQKAPETLTKKQRQHAAKREAEKAAKAEAEAARLAALAKHKRELERARIAEQAKASKKQTSGGMSASVDENGKLIWE